MLERAGLRLAQAKCPMFPLMEQGTSEQLDKRDALIEG